MIALASEQDNLREADAACSGRRSRRRDDYFGNFAEALPSTREFVRAFIPGRGGDAGDDRGGGPF